MFVYCVLSTHLHNQKVPECHTAQPLNLKLLLLNSRSVNNKASLICDLITDKSVAWLL